MLPDLLREGLRDQRSGISRTNSGLNNSQEFASKMFGRGGQ